MPSEVAPRPLRAQVRPATADDRDFLVSLSETAFRPYARNPSVVMLRMMRGRPSAKTAILIAEEVRRGKPRSETRLGFAVVVLRELGRPYGPWVDPFVAYLDAIAVRPEKVGRGVGHLLLTHAEDFASAQGAVSMSLLTAESNLPARRLFRSAGYQPILPIDKAYIDEQSGVTMIKPLSDRAPTSAG